MGERQLPPYPAPVPPPLLWRLAFEDWLLFNLYWLLSANFKPKTTAAAPRRSLATARLSCRNMGKSLIASFASMAAVKILTVLCLCTAYLHLTYRWLWIGQLIYTYTYNVLKLQLKCKCDGYLGKTMKSFASILNTDQWRAGVFIMAFIWLGPNMRSCTRGVQFSQPYLATLIDLQQQRDRWLRPAVCHVVLSQVWRRFASATKAGFCCCLLTRVAR